MTTRQSPLVPRNGHILVVGVMARISGCANQKEVSLDDQIDHAKEEVAALHEGPVDYRVIATKGKGERLDRPELAEIEQLLRTRELDILVAEDIGRIVRGTEAARLLGIAVDHGTRVIAPNDCIDTAEETWEEDVISACRDHVGHNAHTSKRLKQKLMNRFVKFGGATAREIFGYIKPPGAKTYDDLRKDEAVTPTFEEWFRRLRAIPNCSAVADWLNATGIPTGKYCRRATWDGPMVRRLTANPILIGKPERGRRHTVKHHETGRRVSVPKPGGPRVRDCPHLAHLDEATFREVNALLDAANAPCRHHGVAGLDPRAGVSRKRTRFPGRCASCWYCGREFIWGGNGQASSLTCGGSRVYRCWNSVGIDGQQAARRVMGVISAELARLAGFDDQLRELVVRASAEGTGDDERLWTELTRDEAEHKAQEANFLSAIAAFGARPMLRDKLSEIDAGRSGLVARRRDLERRRGCRPELPDSAAALRRLFEEQTRELAESSFEFGDALRRLVPEFHVYLVRALDGGHLLPRARVKLRLAGVVPDAERVPEFEDALTRVVTVDLFEPTQRARILNDAVRLAADGLEHREIARRLSEGVTQTAVSRTLLLAGRMRELGVESPYALVTQPPDDYGKLRRHLHPRYRFQPAVGFRQPVL